MSENYRTFQFTADSIDGVIQEFPKKFFLRCDQVQIIGASQVRNYTGTWCIQVMNVFLIQYNGQLLGSKCFKTFEQFVRFIKSVCQYDYFLMNGRNLLINGCKVSI